MEVSPDDPHAILQGLVQTIELLKEKDPAQITKVSGQGMCKAPSLRVHCYKQYRVVHYITKWLSVDMHENSLNFFFY